MINNDEIEQNKINAAQGWIGQPVPAQGERTPESHVGKWAKMMLDKGNI